MAEHFNTGLFTYGASSRPETSGMGVAIIGSLYMMVIVLLLALPIGVAASIYLEEFAKKNRLTDLIEVNINNLAAVPSIVFGLLGPRRLHQLPRHAALGSLRRRPGADADDAADDHHRDARRPCRGAAVDPLGSTRPWRFQDADGVPAHPAAGRARHPDRHHHRPGACARRNRAAAADRHGGLRRRLSQTPFDPATALPVQIYMWANEAERAFVERMSGAIIILLVFLMAMNITAIVLRRRFERRW